MKLKTVLYKNGAETIVDAADKELFEAFLADGWADSPNPPAPSRRKKAEKQLTEGDGDGVDETTVS